MDLADVIGSLLQRSLVFTKNNFDSKIPKAKKLDAEDKKFKKTVAERVKKTKDLMLAYRMQEALHTAVDLARESNKYFNEREPWHSIKTDPEKAKTTLYLTANALRSLAIILEPFVPFTSRAIFGQLNLKFEKIRWDDALKEGLKEGHSINAPTVLFRKIEAKEIEGKKKVIEARSKR